MACTYFILLRRCCLRGGYLDSRAYSWSWPRLHSRYLLRCSCTCLLSNPCAKSVENGQRVWSLGLDDLVRIFRTNVDRSEHYLHESFGFTHQTKTIGCSFQTYDRTNEHSANKVSVCTSDTDNHIIDVSDSDKLDYFFIADVFQGRN